MARSSVVRLTFCTSMPSAETGNRPLGNRNRKPSAQTGVINRCAEGSQLSAQSRKPRLQQLRAASQHDVRVPGLRYPRVELGFLVDQMPLAHGDLLEMLSQGMRGEQAGIGAADHHGMTPTRPGQRPLPETLFGVQSLLGSYVLNRTTAAALSTPPALQPDRPRGSLPN